MKTHITIILLTAAVFAGTLFLIVDYNRAAEDEVIRRFHAQQLHGVRQLVHEMDQYLRDRSQGAQVLSRFASLQHRDMKKIAADFQEYFQYVKKDYVKAISVYDEKGTIIYSTTEDAIGRNYANCDFSQWAAKKENKGKQFVSSLIRVAEDQVELPPYYRFLIVTPIYQETLDPWYPKPTHKFVGVLTITIDLEEVIAAFLPWLGNSATKQHVWIVDKSGTVLFQSEHPEMVLKSVHRRDESCMRCHVSLDYADKILAEKQGTVEYSLREQPKKAAAFAPLTFENVTWIIVVNIPLDEVSGFVARQLARTLLLIGVIAVALVGSSTLIYRSNRSKIRAEEEAKRWREKRELEEKIRESEERYRQLVEISPDAIAVHCEGKIAFVNSAGVQALGARIADELIGKPALEIVHPDDREMVKRRIGAVLAEGKPAPLVEERFLRLDGNVIDVEVAAVATTFQDKPAVQVVVRDIAERKLAELASRRAEEVLQATEKRFRALIERSSDVIALLAADGTILYESPAAMRILGYAFEELKGRNAFELVHPDDLHAVTELLAPFVQTPNANVSSQFRFRHKDGSWRWMDAVGTNLLAEPSVQAIVVNYRDITERRRAEEELGMLAHALRSINESVSITDMEDTILFVNQSFLKTYGYSEDELVGQNISIVRAPNTSPEVFQDILASTLRGGWNGELWNMRKDGSEFPISLSTSVVRDNKGELLALIGVAADITERKRAEEEIRSLAKFPAENPSPVLRIARDGTLLYVNEAGFRLLPDWHLQVGQAVSLMLGEPAVQSMGNGLPQVLDLDHGKRVYSFFVAPIVAAGYANLYGRDITERRQSEKALRENEKRYHSIVENLNQAYYEADRRGAFTYCNPGLLLISGYSEKELLGIISFKIVAEEHRKNVIALYKQWMEEKRTDMSTEFMVQTKSGRKFWVGQVSHIEFDASGAFVKATNILRDIDERKQAEEALKESEQRFRTLTEFAITGVYMIQEGLFRYVNPILATIFGYDVDEIMNKLDPLDLTAPEDRDVVAENIRKRVEGVIPQIRYSFKGLRKDGQRLDIEVHGTRIESRGKPAIIGTLLDITERMRAETDLKRTLEWQEAIFEGSRDAVFIADSQDRFVAVNIAASDLTGYTREELLKMRIPDLHEEVDLAAYNQFRDRILAGEPILSEARIRRKDGLKVGTEFSNSRVIIAGIPYMHTTARDITERTRAEESLRASEAKYRDLIERAWDAIFVVDRNGTILLANTRACELLGCEREEALKMNIADSYLVEERHVVGERIALAEKGEHWRYERAFLRKDGAVFPVEVTIGLLPDGTIQGIMRDITERKRAEEVLRYERNKTISILEAMEDGVYIVNQQYDVEYLNPALIKEFGPTEGRKCYEYFHDRKEVCSWCPNQEVLAGKTFRWEWFSFKNQRTYGLIDTPLRNPDGSTSKLEIFRDITERKQAEDKLRKSEARFRSYFDLPLHGSAITSPEKRWIEVNSRICSILGYTRDELACMTWADMTHPDDLSADVEQFNRLLSGETEQYTLEKRFIRKDGGVVWTSIGVGCVRESDGSVDHIVAYMEDISARKRAEEALRSSEEKYRALIGHMNDGLIVVDNNDAIQFVNERLCKMVGYLQEELIGNMAYRMILPEESWKLSQEKNRQRIQGISEQYELEMRKKSGGRFWASVSASPVYGSKNEVIGSMAVISDISARKLAEKASRQAAEEIGKAHDQLVQLNKHLTEVREEERALISREIHDELGQSLTALKIDLSWVREHVAKTPAVRQRLNTMLDVMDGTAKNVQRIASELRPSILDDLGLAPAIEWYCEEFEKRSGIKCRTDLEETQLKDPQKNLTMFRVLQEALTNVIRHANATTVKVKLRRLGEDMNLEIKDDGIGIGREKVFASDSLGLIGMRERTKQFNGHFEIFSEKKKGTTLRISLPIHS